MTEIAFYSSFVITLLMCVGVLLILRAGIRRHAWTECRAKSIYSIVVLVSGMSGGTLVFNGLVRLFALFGAKPAFGHGEIIVAAVVFNLLLGLVLLVIGRTVLGWRKMRW